MECDNDEFHRHAAQYTGAVPRVSSVMKGPVSKVVCCTFAPDTPAELALAVTVPMMERIPVEALFTPPPAAAEQFPVIFKVPVEELIAPKDVDHAPPVQFPVIFNVPVEELVAPTPELADAPVQFPVIFKVPVEELVAP